MLSDETYRILNTRIRECRQRIESLGLTIQASGDPASFADARREFPGYAHPAFDPEAGAQLGPGDMLWLSLKEAGETVGVVASRRFVGVLADLLHRRQFWGFDRPSIEDIEPFPVGARRALSNIRGTLSYQGGLVLRRKPIRLQVATPLMHLIRLASFRHWAEDWQCAFYLSRTDPHRRRFLEWGYPNRATLFDRPAGPGPLASHDREEIAYVSAAEILQTLLPEPILTLARATTTETAWLTAPPAQVAAEPPPVREHIR